MLRKVAQSRAAVVVGTVVALAVPVMTLPRIPSVSPWPLLIGMVPWILAKYLLCPLRWRLLTPQGPDGRLSRGWHLRAYAEAELFGLITPGHVGADVWRLRRLTRTGLGRGDALLSVGMDRFVGSIALAVFVAFAATELPTRLLAVALGFGVALIVAGLVARKLRPNLLPSGQLPRPKALAVALLISALFQLSIAGLLLGAIAATGNSLSIWAVFGAFGASQLAGAVPGPNGASPREAALVVALAAVGVPWLAATAAVTLKATLAWLPALTLGGLSLWWLRRQPGAHANPSRVAA
jgi:hypothetical protein